MDHDVLAAEFKKLKARIEAIIGPEDPAAGAAVGAATLAPADPGTQESPPASAVAELTDRLVALEERVEAIWSSDEALAPKIAAFEEFHEKYGEVFERIRSELAREAPAEAPAAPGTAAAEGAPGGTGGTVASPAATQGATATVGAGVGGGRGIPDPTKQPGY